ncbi:MAG: methylenetetrahydrofolate reductase C-terminal domain-containing protein [Spirochaetaceae bacterium]|nr:methylenetetrahydrofolate reductase C-terminal domain-containing protein [Spirochaetaceae bacterium]
MTKLQYFFSETKNFLIGAEIVPSRGIIPLEHHDKISDFAETLCQDDRVHWISITDNAGGNPRLSPSFLGEMILQQGKSVIIHMTCKDGNRNSLESLAWMYASEGLDNLLVMSGDYPVAGDRGTAQPVFDLDSVGLLSLLSDMNRGLRMYGRKPGSVVQLSPTEFFLGAVVSPFKLTEAEQVMQYEKLELKIKAGAQFIIPQLGYDMRKFHELKLFMDENKLNVPLIGNVYKLSGPVARLFHKGVIPGCIVSDSLMEKVEKEKKSPDKGKAFFIDLAAKQIVTFKGMGYRAAYLCGIENHRDFDDVLEKAKEYETSDWKYFIPELLYPNSGEFFYYGKDEKTGLSDSSVRNVRPGAGDRRKYRKYVSPAYRFSRIVHSLIFSKRSLFYQSRVNSYKFLEKHKTLNKLSYNFERAAKSLMFNCHECGDCSLSDIKYLCPQSQCAKNQRNGPCGGSLNNMCEAFPEKTCIWVKAYGRQRYFREKTTLLDRDPIIKDNSLKNTSGWANYFLGRDHQAEKHRFND